MELTKREIKRMVTDTTGLDYIPTTAGCLDRDEFARYARKLARFDWEFEVYSDRIDFKTTGSPDARFSLKVVSLGKEEMDSLTAAVAANREKREIIDRNHETPVTINRLHVDGRICRLLSNELYAAIGRAKNATTLAVSTENMPHTVFFPIPAIRDLLKLYRDNVWEISLQLDIVVDTYRRRHALRSHYVPAVTLCISIQDESVKVAHRVKATETPYWGALYTWNIPGLELTPTPKLEMFAKALTTVCRYAPQDIPAETIKTTMIETANAAQIESHTAETEPETAETVKPVKSITRTRKTTQNGKTRRPFDYGKWTRPAQLIWDMIHFHGMEPAAAAAYVDRQLNGRYRSAAFA